MMNKSRTSPSSLAISAAVALLTVFGCKHGSEAGLKAPKCLFIAVDVSDKSPERLLAYAAAAYRFQRGLKPGDTVRIYEFAHDPQLIYEGPPIRGRSPFNSKVASRFPVGDLSMDKPGTRTHLALGRLLTDSRRKSGQVSIVVMTDGGIEQLDSEVAENLRAVLSGSDRSSGFHHLLVAGVNQEWRSRWEDWTASLGTKATVRGLRDLASVDSSSLWGEGR